MGLFLGRRRPETRAPAMVGHTAPVMTGGGYRADLSHAETSLQKVAVWSTVDLISSLASEMPVGVYRGEDDDRRRVAMPRYLQDPAADGTGLEDWIYQLLISWLLRGNAFGIVRDRSSSGTPTAVELLHPDLVSVWLEDGEPVYSYQGRRIPPEQVFHKRVYPMPGTVLGMSPVAHHAATIGLALASTQFGLGWFQDGAHPSGLLTNSETDLTPEVAKTAKQRFLASLHGRREPVVLGRGWAYQQIQINPEESQFLETNQFTAAECARIYGPGLAEILGYESGGSMTYANVESRATSLLVFSLNRWLRRVERVLSSMLPRPQYAQLNREALLQSTTLTRYQTHQLALRNGWETINEVRRIEDLPPVPWGDEPWLPSGQSAPDGGDTDDVPPDA